MIKLINPRRFVIGGHLAVGSVTNDNQIAELVRKELLRHGVICDKITIEE